MFFLEHDTGTEPLGRLVDKVARYTGTPDRPVPRLPVLFWLHSAAREQHLHQRLSSMHLPTTVATAARDNAAEGASPADPSWTRHGDAGQRVSLADLGFCYDAASSPSSSQRAVRRHLSALATSRGSRRLSACTKGIVQTMSGCFRTLCRFANSRHGTVRVPNMPSTPGHAAPPR